MAYAEDCKSFYTGSIPVPASKKDLFQRSSVVEQSAVNRSVVGSSPTAGAIKKDPIWGLFFITKIFFSSIYLFKKSKWI